MFLLSNSGYLSLLSNFFLGLPSQRFDMLWIFSKNQVLFSLIFSIISSITFPLQSIIFFLWLALGKEKHRVKFFLTLFVFLVQLTFSESYHIQSLGKPILSCISVQYKWLKLNQFL